MFRKIDDFITQWQYEKDATSGVFKNLTDASLNQKVASDGRSIGRLAWHIVLSIGEMIGRTGLKDDGPPQDSAPPIHVTDIVSAFDHLAGSVSEQVKTNWSDEMLTHEVSMYGEKWTLGFVLEVLIRHQIHHRAQITVLMRQAGLKVPGVYGPSKEELSQFGMPAME
ncbi:DinB family protein [bacterium]|nr:DinB family protein [bacterium]